MSSVYISCKGLHTASEAFRLEVKDSLEREREIMFAEMTPGSKHTLAITRKGIERNCCVLYRQQKPRPGSRTKDQRHTKSPCFRTCLTFCFKDRARMEQREAPPVDSHHTEGTEGRLRELTSKWFIETQVPHIVHNGFFPAWFLGFILRKDAEEILREKERGCFLIRLSDKAIGYILSYKGRDRCRHFVINQDEWGQFVVSGDTEGHNTVPDLIEYYKTSPIQPFGEYLTYPCFDALNEELYDVIQVKEKPVVTIREEKNVRKQQINSASEQPPTRPPKSNRMPEEVPPLPRRSRHLDSGLQNDQDRVLYADLRKQQQLPREIPRFQHNVSQDNLPGDNPGNRAERSALSQGLNISRCSSSTLMGPDSVYSELNLLDTKSRSLPLLDNNSSDGELEPSNYRLSALPHTPPRLSPRPVRQANCHSPPTEGTYYSCSRPGGRQSPEYASDSAIYHLAGRPLSPHTTTTSLSEMRLLPLEPPTDDSLYAEVPREALIGHGATHFNTHQRGHQNTSQTQPDSNTYEPLEELRPKQNHSSSGLKNDKWKWLFPDAKRKW